MKKISLLLLMLLGAMSAMFSCSEDPDPSLLLTLDGENSAAPFFEANTTYETAVRFSAALVRQFNGKSMTHVDVYIDAVPESLELRIYAKGTSSTPGTLLHSQAVTISSPSKRWQRIALTKSLALGTEEIWIAMKSRNSSRIQVIGCDQGPAVSGGDWIKKDADDWKTFLNFTSNAASINWNIRGVIVP